MKTKILLPIILALILTACAPAQTFTPTATPAPSTPTLSATSAPPPAATIPPIPTPLGGFLKLLIVASNALQTINSDGSGTDVIVPRGQFEKIFPAISASRGVPYLSAVISPDGKKILVITCTFFGFSCENKILYLSTVDLTTIVKFKSYSGGLLQWSPDSNNILLQGLGNSMSKQIVSANASSFGSITHLPESSAAFWSFDGANIYYYDNGLYVVKSDGTGRQTVKCDLCSMAGNLSSYAIAASPDDQRIAIGYKDGTLIIASADLSTFKTGRVGGYINQLHWSPDSQKVAVDINTDSSQTDIFVVGLDDSIIEKLPRPQGINYINTCGWSPDSQQIDYLAILESGNAIYLQRIGQEKPTLLMSVKTDSISCPVWLSTQP